MLLIDIEGTSLSNADKEILSQPLISGVVLFTRNFLHKEQLKNLCDAIHALNPRLFIAVDQEGGRVQRFTSGFTTLPAMRHWGQLYQQDMKKAEQGLQDVMTVLAQELFAVGVDISLVPVLDIDHGVSWVIGERSFGKEPNMIVALSNILIDTLHGLKMPVTGKHFPGHGGVAADSHASLPVDRRSMNVLMESDLQPFAKLAHKLDAIMPAHVVYEKMDRQPAGFSSYWLQNILRGQFGFDGVIISDDLSMQGACDAIPDVITRAQMALQAGCDLLCVCNNQKAVIKILSHFSSHPNAAATVRIESFRQKMYRFYEQHCITRH